MSPHINTTIFLRTINRNLARGFLVRLLFIAFALVGQIVLMKNVSALTVTTSGLEMIDVSVLGDGASMAVERISVSGGITCPSGQSFIGIEGPTDANLYKDGDSTSSSIIAPTSGTFNGGGASILGENRGTWGINVMSRQWNYYDYYDCLIDGGEYGSGCPSIDSYFHTPSPEGETYNFFNFDNDEYYYNEEDWGDLAVFYGVSATETQEPGTYTFSEGNAITYYAIQGVECSQFEVKYHGNYGYEAEWDEYGQYIGYSGEMSISFDGSELEENDVTLAAPNFKREGYGFVGWSLEQLDPDDEDNLFYYIENALNNSRLFGPNETLAAGEYYDDFFDHRVGDYESNGNVTYLYAVWVPSEGSMQDWEGCSSMNGNLQNYPFTAITALTDERDGETYAIAKLGDGRCWMIENLRLDYDADNNSDGALAQGYGGDFAGLAEPEWRYFSNVTTANSLYYSGTQSGTASIDIGANDAPASRIPRYNNDNTDYISGISSADSDIRAYGNYYNWPAAMANTDYLDSSNSTLANTSICPSGWKLPHSKNSSGGLGYLLNHASGYWDDWDATTTEILRRVPNNFVYSGYAYGSSITDRGSYGNYWTSSANVDGSYALYLRLYDNGATINTNNKYIGMSVRCIFDEKIIHFSPSGGTGNMPAQEILQSDTSATIRSNVYTRTGYTFAGWNTASDRSGTHYDDGVSVSSISFANGDEITLYAEWDCAPGYVCFNYTGATGGIYRMEPMAVDSSATSVLLKVPTFNRTSYGFAGWSTSLIGSLTNNNNNYLVLNKPNGVDIYGPQETIVDSGVIADIKANGLELYPIWVYWVDSLQTFNSCGSLEIGDVTALKDNRDNKVYAVARLADGECWMIENLRLEAANSTNASLAQGYGTGFTGLANNETANFSANGVANSLYSTDGSTTNTISGNDTGYRFPRYNHTNTLVNVSYYQYFYYGNYYTWAAAKANTDDLSDETTSNAANTSICPAGWHLPSGGGFGEYGILSNSLGGYNDNGEAKPMDSSTTPTGAEMSEVVRSFPNNFVGSGLIDGNTISGRGVDTDAGGYYWSATAYDGESSYTMTFTAEEVDSTTLSGKELGKSIRCIKD